MKSKINLMLVLLMSVSLTACNSSDYSCEDIFEAAVVPRLLDNQKMGARFKYAVAGDACAFVMADGVTRESMDRFSQCMDDVVNNAKIKFDKEQDISKIKTLTDGTVECRVSHVKYYVYYNEDVARTEYSPDVEYTYRTYDDKTGVEYYIKLND